MDAGSDGARSVLFPLPMEREEGAARKEMVPGVQSPRVPYHPAKARLAVSKMRMNKETFACSADFRAWQRERIEGVELDMRLAMTGIVEPSYYPAVLLFRWLTSGADNKISLLYDWVNHEDFKSHPVVMEKVQLANGQWVERKVPHKPARERAESPPIRGMTLD